MASEIKLSGISPDPPKNLKKEVGIKKTEKLLQEMAELQNLLFAQKKYSVLIILQGMDASGKDGTIKKVFSGINPMGCNVKAFKAPTEEEKAHDFLWRVHQHVPEKGMIHIFNRSHYEDVLIQRVHKWIDRKTVQRRFEDINHFERLLQDDNNTTVLKFFLHISKEHQIKSLTERLDDKTKRWKYSVDDIKEREYWGDYMKAYESVFKHCGKAIPWNIVPANHNWYKEYFVAKIIVDALRKMDLKYPVVQRQTVPKP